MANDRDYAQRSRLDDFVLATGNACVDLARQVAKRLKVDLARATVGAFSDGETRVEFADNLRGRQVYLLQSVCAPANDRLMELLLMADAARRSSAAEVVAVTPYLGYSRQDRRPRSARTPISARLVADLIAGAGVARLLTIDLHSEQIQGFYKIPVDNIYAMPVLLGDLAKRAADDCEWRVVSPDVGGVARARAMAQDLGAELAIIDKRRPGPNQAQVMHIIGNVDGCDCVLVDDLVDTAKTLCLAAAALKREGARRVLAYCTHAVLSGDAAARVADSELDELTVADSVPLVGAARDCDKIRVLTVADLLAAAILRVHQKETLNALFGH